MTSDDDTAHCGTCDRTRHIELPDGRFARCPRCHPLRHEYGNPTCRTHPGEDAVTCRFCLAASSASHRPTGPGHCEHGTPPGVDCLACARNARAARPSAPITPVNDQTERTRHTPGGAL